MERIFSCSSLAQRGLLALGLFLGLGFAPANAESDVAMVTFMQGVVTRSTTQGSQRVQSFIKLKQGDSLALEQGARLQLVYFSGGRQETWGGDGRLEISEIESHAHGLSQPEVKMLPSVMVQQIAKTPSLETQGRAGMVRMRAIPTPDAIAQVEKTYKSLRLETDRDDLSPELFLLSGLFEMRELDRVEQILGDLRRSRKGNPEVGLLVALYQKAVRNAREARAK